MQRPRLHRRHAADPRHRPHRFPERRRARAIRFDLQQAAASCRTRRWSSRRTTTRATPSPPSARRRPSIRACRSNRSMNTSSVMDKPQPAQSEDDGRRGAGQHARRLRAGGDRAARLGGDGAPTRSRSSGRTDVALIDLREAAEREKHGVIPGSLHAPYPDLQEHMWPGRHACTSLPPRPASACCSTAPSASARRWRCRPRRMPGSHSACHIQGGIDAWEGGRGVRWSRPSGKSLPDSASPSSVQDLAEEQLGALVLRVREERLRLVDLDDLPGVHEAPRGWRPGGRSPSRGSPPAWSCRPWRARPWCRAPP